MTQTIILTSIGAVGVLLAALAGLVYARVQDYRRAVLRTASVRCPAVNQQEPARSVSDLEIPTSRYQPMFRLLTGEDANFLLQHGHCASVKQRWSLARHRVVRIYLKELASDFESLHREARALAAQSPEPLQMMIVLFRQQIAFWRALIWIDLRLTWGGAGLSKINPAALAGAFEAIRREIADAAAVAPNQPA